MENAIAQRSPHKAPGSSGLSEEVTCSYQLSLGVSSACVLQSGAQSWGALPVTEEAGLLGKGEGLLMPLELYDSSVCPGLLQAWEVVHCSPCPAGGWKQVDTP